MLNEIEKGQLAISTVQCFTGLKGSLSNFPGLIKRVIEERVWECRSHHGRVIELPNLRALITTKPIEGWGQDPKKIEAVIKDDAEALAMFREAMKVGQGKRVSLGDNVTEAEPSSGNSLSYTLDRLKREAPELFQRVVGKELSANAAAIEAGFRVKTITVPLDPSRAAAALKRSFSREEVDIIRELLA